MALIKCFECKKEVSSKARACPNCGARHSIDQLQRVTYIMVIIAISVCGLIAVSTLYGISTIDF